MKIDKVKYVMTAVTVALSVGAAYAAPNVANVTQKGSLLILPKIDVRDNVTTLVNVENDGDVDAYIKGYYVDTLKCKKDLKFKLTPHQKLTFDAKTGKTSAVNKGPSQVPPFPSTEDYCESGAATGIGELVLWATDSNGINQIRHNHLTAKAIEVDFAKGTAWEYQGWSFYARADTPGGLLLLNGVAYDLAPQYLFAGFTPKGTTQNVAGGTVETLSNTIYLSSATQDLRQDYRWIVTKLDFDIWNGDEVKYTNAYRCSDSVFETALEPVADPVGTPGVLNPNPMRNGTNFTYTALGTEAALFRVQGNASTQCNAYHIETPAQGSTPATYTPSQNVGLVGVKRTEVKVTPTGQTNEIGTALNAAGVRAGSILWDTDIVTPEKK